MPPLHLLALPMQLSSLAFFRAASGPAPAPVAIPVAAAADRPQPPPPGEGDRRAAP